MMRRDWGTPFLRALVFAAGLIVAVVLGSRLLHGNAQAAVGHPAPSWSLTTPQGDQVALADFQGRPLLLNFWAVWCPPCRAEMPLLAQAASQYPNLAVLAVDVGDSAADVTAFLQSQGLTLPVALDENGQVANRYHVQGLPTSFFLDAQGIVRFIHIGALDKATLAEGLQAVGETP